MLNEAGVLLENDMSMGDYCTGTSLLHSSACVPRKGYYGAAKFVPREVDIGSDKTSTADSMINHSNNRNHQLTALSA